MGYFKTALNGFSWMGLYRILYRALGILRIAIIARILSPLSLGQFAIVTMVLGFVEIMTETGINIFLIQKDEEIDRYLNTAWIISIIRGFLIFLIIFLLAGKISEFFVSEESRNLLYLSSLIPLVRGFINPSIVKFQKQLFFRGEFLYRLTVFLVEVLVSVILVLITHNVYSMVLGLLAGAVFEMFYTFVKARPVPRFNFNISLAKEILTRGKWITLYGVSDYLYTQADNIVVGRILGVYDLGIYQNAYKISTSPLTEVGDVFFRVTFPIFSKISNETKRLKTAFFKNLLTTFLLMSIAGIVVFTFADLIVKIVLGSGWESAIPVVRLLAILGVVRGVAASTNSLLVAKNMQKYSAIVTLVSFLGLIATIIPLTKMYGIIGSGSAAIFGTLVSLPFTIYYVRKTLR